MIYFIGVEVMTASVYHQIQLQIQIMQYKYDLHESDLGVSFAPFCHKFIQQVFHTL